MPTMHFKDSIKLEDRATISLWLGDSQTWANTAVMLDECGHARPGESIVNSDHNQLNVAHVSMGLAFELGLKALAVSEGRGFSGKHLAVTNYGKLSQSSRNKVAQAIANYTGMPAKDYLEYLDERMCHPDRKYWMVDRSGADGGQWMRGRPPRVQWRTEDAPGALKAGYQAERDGRVGTRLHSLRLLLRSG